MATKAQRAKAFVDSLTNHDTSQANITRIVNATRGLSSEQVASMTNQEKLDRFFFRMRSYILQQVKAYESKAAVTAAIEASEVQVDNDFTEGA